MRNKLAEMWQIKEFGEFMGEMVRSANYHVANLGQQDAIDICLAYAFEAGLKKREPKKNIWQRIASLWSKK